MIKYILTYYIEKLHRYCFDTIYIQDYNANLIDLFLCRLLIVFQLIIPDYRKYLRKWHEDKKTCYLRYTPYEKYLINIKNK